MRVASVFIKSAAMVLICVGTTLQQEMVTCAMSGPECIKCLPCFGDSGRLCFVFECVSVHTITLVVIVQLQQIDMTRSMTMCHRCTDLDWVKRTQDVQNFGRGLGRHNIEMLVFCILIS